MIDSGCPGIIEGFRVVSYFGIIGAFGLIVALGVERFYFFFITRLRPADGEIYKAVTPPLDSELLWALLPVEDKEKKQDGNPSGKKSHSRIAYHDTAPGYVSSYVRCCLEEGSGRVPGDETLDKLTFDLQNDLTAGLRWISTAFKLAPLFGILGTVVGSTETLYRLSSKVSAQAGGSPSMEAFLSGIRVAFGTTMWGLTAAVIGILIYNLLEHWTEGRVKIISLVNSGLASLR